MTWLVCQIGAREHYAIPRAIHQAGKLGALYTDSWVGPDSLLYRLPIGRRLRDRWQPQLADATVIAPNARLLAFELKQRAVRSHPWQTICNRNKWFQKRVISELQKRDNDGDKDMTLFAYSYAALELFQFAKEQGWRTVLGQIDPGPEEEAIVASEHQRYKHLATSWQPAPPAYWQSWREEVQLADRVVVNSPWSKECLLKEGVPAEKMEIIPLVYERVNRQKAQIHEHKQLHRGTNLHVLFLGQINLRKGIGRLLDAMRLLKDDPIELTMAGPSEISPELWEDLPTVKWVGAVPRSAVDGYYQDADLFILPTLSDGYALTQLEALANGVPVLASQHCGRAVVDGENGWILEDLEPQTIARQLRALALKPLPGVRNSSKFGLNHLADRLLDK